MSVDPRSTLKTILMGVIATKDDNATPATILVIYEGGPETYRHIFETLNYDACIAIGRQEEVESGVERRIQDQPLRYNDRIPVWVSAINKTGVTATKLLNKIRFDITQLIEANAQAANYTWILQRNEGRNERKGGYDPLWQDHFTVFRRPLQS